MSEATEDSREFEMIDLDQSVCLSVCLTHTVFLLSTMEQMLCKYDLWFNCQIPRIDITLTCGLILIIQTFFSRWLNLGCGSSMFHQKQRD